MHYERPGWQGGVCSKSWQLQELYECVDSKPIGSDAGDGIYSWKREQCVPDDKLPGAACDFLAGRVSSQCPGAPQLTYDRAMDYQCSDNCAKTIVSMYEYCGTTWFKTTQGFPEQGAGSIGTYYTLIQQDPPGPCTATLRASVLATMTAVQRDPVCGVRYDLCAADGICRFEMMQGLASNLFGNAQIERKFEVRPTDSTPRAYSSWQHARTC
jgi:hypothetical protein